MLLTNKYAPRTSKDVLGQEWPISNLKRCISNNKSAVVFGGVGNGKTSSVYAIANELGYEVFEINSSDFRNKEKITSVLDSAVNQASLFNPKKVILIDDIDALSGVKDRGGLQVITEMISKSKFPFVLTSYDIDDSKFKDLKRKCSLIEFNIINSSYVFDILRNICENENVNVKDDLLKNIARKSGGDVRSAINELNMVFYVNQDNDFFYKNNRADINDLLNLIFKSKNTIAIEQVFNDIDENIDDVMLWVDENLPLVYKGKDLSDAYDKLSKADLFKGRIRNRQYYRYMVYQKYFMSSGVAMSKSEKLSFENSYKRNSRILKIWIANRKNMKKKAICEKIAEKIHLSKKKAFQEFPFMQKFITNEVSYELELNDEELEYFDRYV